MLLQKKNTERLNTGRSEACDCSSVLPLDKSFSQGRSGTGTEPSSENCCPRDLLL